MGFLEDILLKIMLLFLVWILFMLGLGLSAVVWEGLTSGSVSCHEHVEGEIY
jgi:hypothetical protein